MSGPQGRAGQPMGDELTTILLIVGNIIADILLAVVDPRIKVA